MCVVKSSSIKKKEFSFAFKSRLAPDSLFYHGLYMSLYAIREKEIERYAYSIRIGLIISKKAGKAAERNRIKRRLRVLTRFVIVSTSNIGYYYIVLSHKNIMQASYENLYKDLTTCLKKIK